MVGAAGERLDIAETALASRTASAGCLVRIAREYDRKGRLPEAEAALAAALASAEASGDRRVAADALRRLAVVHCRRQMNASARALCARSEAIGREIDDRDVVAEALNTAGGLDLMDERFDDARARFLEAEAVARDPDLLGRIQQNLATVAGTQGDFVEALDRNLNSLTGFQVAGNEQGCAVAYHNLGVVSNDLQRWADADRYLRLCLQAVRLTGDLHLRGLATLNHAQALAGLGRLREGLIAAEMATGIFDELHAPRELADAYRVLGSVLRQSGELAAAQTRLRLAIEVASTSRCALSEAEATRELALVLAALGSDGDAIALMGQAAIELERFKPAGALAAALAGTYPASVRAWGDLLAVLDPESKARAERVAAGAVVIAQQQGCDEVTQARVRVAGYLHEVIAEWVPDGALPWDTLAVLRGLRDGVTVEARIVAAAAAGPRHRR